MKNAYIGSAIERREDLRFLRGRGQYVDDLRPEGLLYAVILRSSVAHGRIVSINAAVSGSANHGKSTVGMSPSFFSANRTSLPGTRYALSWLQKSSAAP